MGQRLNFPIKSEEFSRLAEYCDSMGDTESAIIYLREALAKETDVYRKSDLYARLAHQYLVADRVEYANKCMYLAMSLRPREPEYYATMMLHMLAIGDAESAEYYYSACDKRRILAAFPKLLEQMQEHDFDAEAVRDAVQDFLQTEDKPARDLPDWKVISRKSRTRKRISRAYLMMTAGVFPLAIEELKQIRNEQGDRLSKSEKTDIANALACCYIHTDDLQAAHQEFDTLQQSGKQDVDTLCLRYALAQQEKDIAAQEETLQALCDCRAETFPEWYKIIHTFHEAQWDAGILRFVADRIKERPYVYEFYRFRGIAQYNSGNFDAARRTFVDMVRLFGDLTDAGHFLHWIAMTDRPSDRLHPTLTHDTDSPITGYYRSVLAAWLQDVEVKDFSGDVPDTVLLAIDWLCEVPDYMPELFRTIETLCRLPFAQVPECLRTLICTNQRIQVPVYGHIVYSLMTYDRCTRFLCVSDNRFRELVLRVPSDVRKLSQAATSGYCLLYAMLQPEQDRMREQLFLRGRYYASKMRESGMQVRRASAFAWALCKIVFGIGLEDLIPYVKVPLRTAQRYLKAMRDIDTANGTVWEE